MSELSHKPLGDPDYFKVIMGQSPPSSAYNDEGQGLPFYQGKADFGLIYPSPRKYCTEPTRIAEKDDILISVRAPVGPTNMASEKCSIGRGLAAIRCKNGVLPKFLLYALRSIEREIADSVRDQGGGFTSIKRDQLKEFEIPRRGRVGVNRRVDETVHQESDRPALHHQGGRAKDLRRHPRGAAKR